MTFPGSLGCGVSSILMNSVGIGFPRALVQVAMLRREGLPVQMLVPVQMANETVSFGGPPGSRPRREIGPHEGPLRVHSVRVLHVEINDSSHESRGGLGRGRARSARFRMGT